MRREPHVRIREGLGVKLPRATRLVMGFRDQRDAQRVLDVLPKRFGKYGLTVHPTKTKLVPFCPPPARAAEPNGPGAPRPGTFDLLGFTHYWGRSRRGYWVIKQKTAADRFSRAVRSIDRWCRANRHISIGEQQQKLNQKLRGHYAYYGVTGNSGSLSRFLWEVERRWRKWLMRRSRQRTMTWARLRLPAPALPAGACAHRAFDLRQVANP